MAEKIKINETGDCIFTEQDAIDLLYTNPDFDISKLFFKTTKQYNNSIKDTGVDFEQLQTVPNRPTPAKVDETNIANWFMPQKYYELNVLEWLLNRWQTDIEKKRVEQEYLLFEKKKFIKVLQFLIYFIDILRANNIIWGVGRGSSVASFCLFLIGVHKINPLQYDLNITEFLR